MIKGTEGMTDADILAEVAKGGRFAIHLYAVSILVMTFRRSSAVEFVKAGETRRGWAWTGLTLIAGWWGIPWGPIYSIQSIATNLAGGRDVTDQIVRRAG